MLVNNVPDLRIQDLHLINFRNHPNLNIESNHKFILLLGKNGIGKTNILEAISLLNSNKGMRNAKNSELIYNFNKSHNEWAIKANLVHKGFKHNLLIGCKFENLDSNGSKIIKYNEERIKSISDVSEILKIIWLDPQIENIFGESQGTKRNFLDRITYTFFINHLKFLQEYEYFIQSRTKILSEVKWDLKLLEYFEMNIAELSLKITTNRKNSLDKINKTLKSISSNYLRPVFTISGEIESKLSYNNHVEVFNYILKTLMNSRLKDARSKRCSIGSHKSNVVIINLEKNIEANFCSTGEQKSMIISLIIGHSYALHNEFDIAPVIILDEIFAHLDDGRCMDFIDELSKTPSQIWISSTNKNLDSLFKENCLKFCLESL